MRFPPTIAIENANFIDEIPDPDCRQAGARELKRKALKRRKTLRA